jgi:hypothetical protein
MPKRFACAAIVAKGHHKASPPRENQKGLLPNLTREPGVLDAIIILSHFIHPRNAVDLFVSCSY